MLEEELRHLRAGQANVDVVNSSVIEQEWEPLDEQPLSEYDSVGFQQALGPTSTRRMDTPVQMNASENSRFMSSVTQLSLSSINIPECKPLDGDEEIFRYSYEAWKELLEDTMRLAGVEDDRTKFTIFKIKAGARLLQIFRNTKSQAGFPNPETEPFANAMYRLKSYFGSGSDVMFQRRKLALMMQKPEETSLAFITRVGATARLCEYDEEKEMEEIVGAVAAHAVSKEVRVAALKMLNRKGSFSNLVDKVREIDAIQMNEEYFKLKYQKTEPAMVAPVRAAYPAYSQPPFQRPGSQGGKLQNIGSRRRDSRFNPMRTSRNAEGQNSFRRGFHDQTISASDRCWRCNSVYHLASECNAAHKVCIGCGRKGHIRRACNSLERRPAQYKERLENSKSPETKPSTSAAVNKVEVETENNEDRSEVSENMNI